MAVYTEGVKTNPADGTMLAITDVLSYNLDRVVTVLATASGALGSVKLQYLNAVNTVLKEFSIKVPVNDTKIFAFGPVIVPTGFSLRAVQDGTVVGTIQVGIGF